MNQRLFEQLEQLTLRVNEVIYLGGMLGDGDSFAEPLQELLEDDTEELEKLFPELRVLLDQIDDVRGIHEEVASWLLRNRKLGYVVQFATPVMEQHPPAKGFKYFSATYSWGYYQTARFYGETVGQAMRQGMRWARECRKAEKAKAREKARQAKQASRAQKAVP